MKNLTLKQFARPAALGAIAVCFGVLGLYLFIAIGSRPTATGGIDNTHAVLTWISAGVPAAGFVAVHIAFARILLRYARED